MARSQTSQGPGCRAGRRLRPLDIGELTHGLIAGLAGDAPWPEGLGLTQWVLDRAIIALAQVGATSRRRAALQKSASLAAVYWHRYRPAAEWRLIDAEQALGDNRIDLVWDTGRGILFDELKTSPDALGADDVATREQAERYRLAGLAAYGAAFLGVRVAVLALPRRSAFLSAQGVWGPITAPAQIGGAS
jgi:hypothetical protein